MTALRLLLDQMIDADVATDLRAAGHDVCTVGELGMSRASDAEILKAALDRIRRVAGQPVKPQKPRGTWLAGALVLMLGIVISFHVVSAQGKAEADSPPQEKSQSNVADEELASFPQAVAKRVTAVIANRDLPFVTDEWRKEIDAEFVALVTKTSAAT